MEEKTLFQKLYKRKIGYSSLCVMALLLFFALFAEFFAPYHYETEDRMNPYQPPSRIHIIDQQGKVTWPYVFETSNKLNEYRERIYAEVTDMKYSIRFFVRGDAYKMWGVLPCNIHFVGVEKPGSLYFLGTDNRGRDLLSRILIGARISLSIGIIGVAISLVFGVLIGGISGYFGGKIDACVMRTAEFFMMIPTFYLLLAIRSSLPSHLTSFQVYFLVTCILSVIGWAGLARIIRGMVLTLREREYVQASRLLGASHLSIIVKHIVPHTLSYILVVVSVSVPGYILAESALSMLGLGIQEPFVSWGMLLAESMSITQLRFHPWMLWPGVCIFLTVLACNILGDSLRDCLDPHKN